MPRSRGGATASYPLDLGHGACSLEHASGGVGMLSKHAGWYSEEGYRDVQVN